MAPRLEGVHREPVVRKVGREHSQDVGRGLAEQLTMVVENGERFGMRQVVGVGRARRVQRSVLIRRESELQEFTWGCQERKLIFRESMARHDL
jgi:hypothetical protein